MKLDIKSDTNNTLIGRREVNVTLTFDQATPSNETLKKELAKKLGVKEELIIPRHIYTDFGKTSAEFEVYVYASEEAMKTYEPKTKKMKQDEAKAAKKEEAPAEEVKEEKPEEKKDEKTEEAKKEEPKEEKKEEEKKEDEKK